MKDSVKVCAAVAGAVLASMTAGAQERVEYPDFYDSKAGGTKGIDFVKSISVITPAYCSYVKGDVTVIFEAPGMRTAQVRCWQQDADLSKGGHDQILAEMTLEDGKEAEFVFHADEFPNGPTTIRIQAKDDTNHQDYCELQVYNLGGVKWKQGIPKEDPPGAAGMKLVFADDFDGPLSISPSGFGARYAAHKTGGGDFSGWQFSDPEGRDKPFGQRGTFLRIHARKDAEKARSGILSSMRPDGSGVAVPYPCYFECRFVAQSAPGTWPAFWTLTKGTAGMDKNDPGYADVKKLGCEELDIIEAYGGYGPHNPNSGGLYHSVTHYWGDQKKPEWYSKKLPDGSDNPKYSATSCTTDTLKIGNGSSWSWMPHTYGLAITETDTVYYFDNVEVLRHPTGPASLAMSTWFLINYAIGGISGWPIDMERYDNQTDMWVDFVRVYCGRVGTPEVKSTFVGKKPAKVTISCPTDGAAIFYTTDGSAPTKASRRYAGPFEMSEPGKVRAIAVGKDLLDSVEGSGKVVRAPGVAGSVGINFMDKRDNDRLLQKSDIAGAGELKQANWNEFLIGAQNEKKDLLASDGSVSGMSVRAKGTGAVCEPWSFGGNDGKLKRGALSCDTEVELVGVPYPKYDVVVYLTAGPNSSKGLLSIEKTDGEGGVGPVPMYSVHHGWIGDGRHVVCESTDPANPTNSNYVRFRGVTARSVRLKMKNTDWWVGIGAVQVVPAE